MGKRYHCDYCNKTMVSAPLIVKTHNQGLVHQKLVQEHYHQYKDPKTILAEESTKKPCLRHMQGTCQFGRLCRYSHISKEEIERLKQYVTASEVKSNPTPCFEDLYKKFEMEKSEKQTPENTSIIYDSNGVTNILPWSYNDEFEKYDLPPSLKRMKIEDIAKGSLSEWG